jgi:hypothetical protein
MIAGIGGKLVFTAPIRNHVIEKLASSIADSRFFRTK